MDAVLESNYQLMRFNILSLAIKDLENCPFSHSYVYAWESGVYPVLHDGAKWHEPFRNQFEVSEDEVNELSSFLDKCWLQKKPVTFYNLEDHYKIRNPSSTGTHWTRAKLIVACKYMYLEGCFDQDFWASLLEPGECPTEAMSISRELKASNIFMM